MAALNQLKKTPVANPDVEKMEKALDKAMKNLERRFPVQPATPAMQLLFKKVTDPAVRDYLES